MPHTTNVTLQLAALTNVTLQLAALTNGTCPRTDSYAHYKMIAQLEVKP